MSIMRNLCFLGLVAAICFPIVSIQAEVTWSGDLDPDDPTTWDENTWAYIGNTGEGTLSITNGSDLASHSCYIGNGSGATGDVLLDGIGSTWTNVNEFYVGGSPAWNAGDDGHGTLTITGGATVSNYADCFVGYKSDSTGEVTVDGISSA